MICGFNGEHRFLSNFHPCAVAMEGVVYPSVEHAYQAAKTLDRREREKVRGMPRPGAAKRYGSKITLRADWDAVKVQVMEDLVRKKFADPGLAALLLATGNQHIEETNSWGDQFWGVSDGRGENQLGRILMKVREELKTRRKSRNPILAYVADCLRALQQRAARGWRIGRGSADGVSV